MTSYFNRIKESYYEKATTSGRGHSGSGKELQANFGKIYEKMLKEFNEERQKYV